MHVYLFKELDVRRRKINKRGDILKRKKKRKKESFHERRCGPIYTLLPSDTWHMKDTFIIKHIVHSILRLFAPSCA